MSSSIITNNKLNYVHILWNVKDYESKNQLILFFYGMPEFSWSALWTPFDRVTQLLDFLSQAEGPDH